MINIDDLTYRDLKEIAARFTSLTIPQPSAAGAGQSSPLLGQHVVVRTFSAGVHIGTLVAKDGENVLLRDARRLWKWAGAFTLSEVAQSVVQKSGSRIACVVPLIELTNANEIIPTTEQARASFAACHE